MAEYVLVTAKPWQIDRERGIKVEAGVPVCSINAADSIAGVPITPKVIADGLSNGLFKQWTGADEAAPPVVDIPKPGEEPPPMPPDAADTINSARRGTSGETGGAGKTEGSDENVIDE